MLNGKRMVAIIPARGGSKGLPNKNILHLDGRPLIAHTIRCAKEAGIFDKIIVSTDSEIIANIAVQEGAEVPYLRSAELASDVATGLDVVLDVLAYLNANHQNFELCMLLQPTSPLRLPVDIIDAANLLEHKGCHSVVSVCETEHSPLWTGAVPESLSMSDFVENMPKNKGRQLLQTYYRLNGAIYLTVISELSSQKDFFAEPCFAYIMPQARSVDIDTELDLQFAEFLMQRTPKCD